ncbi:hypothetical protein AK812_SmicGene18630 [Symbiodinium microadriaticum]|uniref:Uncharacterized protein n=1 Tax=Symbiodinium microadriaticum TaxID=2951 RepID=A0A1Q9DUN5_SYMMI|nr:hypothetical protein AK812_SmicGene18630 [Symbiodinium microadriaticum]
MASLMPVLGGHSTDDSRDLPPEDALERLLGQVYDYHVTEAIFRHGQGKFKWTNGRVYEGEWQLGKQHGQGALTVEGKVTKGEWKSGVRVT